MLLFPSYKPTPMTSLTATKSNYQLINNKSNIKFKLQMSDKKHNSFIVILQQRLDGNCYWFSFGLPLTLLLFFYLLLRALLPRLCCQIVVKVFPIPLFITN